MGRSPQGEGCTGFDVAVAGFRGRRHDAEGHQSSRFGGFAAGVDGLAELGGIADQVIRRQHQQQGVLAVGRGLQCGHRHRRGGVAAHRFQQDRIGLHADLPHLFSHDEAVVFIADQQGSCKGVQALKPLLGLLQQRGLSVSA